MSAFLSYLNVLNKITFSLPLFLKKKKQSKFFVCLVSLYVCFASISIDLIFSENLPQSETTVKGRIKLPSGELIPEEGLNVVLLKLVLNLEGHVTPVGPQGRVKTDRKGNFEFSRVNPDYRAGYKLGTRVDGKLYSTKVFFFKPGEDQVEKDITIPGITSDINKLEKNQVSLVIESGLSSVTITEVLSFYNSSTDRIDTKGNLLEHLLPKGMYNFTMTKSLSGSEIEHQIDDKKLIISHVFPPGNTQIIFHYNVRAWYGSLKVQSEFNHSLDKVTVFTPSGQLLIKSAQLIFSGKQKIHDTDFLVWKVQSSDSNKLELKISNVPVDSLEYLGIAVIILLLLFFSVIIFFRNRLMKRDNI